MSLVRSQLRSSIDEYLKQERAAYERHEWLDGLIYAMAGVSAEHSLICSNVIAALGLQLRGRDCAVYSPNMKVYSRRSDSDGRMGLISYPDCTVVCGTAKVYDKEQDVVTNPKVIIEVLSPTTERYDRGKKFLRYQQNESLTDYVLIAQRYSSIELYSRQAEGRWLYTAQTQMNSKIRLESIECELPLSEVYDQIEFPEADEEEQLFLIEREA